MDKLVEKIMRGANIASVVAEDMGELTEAKQPMEHRLMKAFGFKHAGSTPAAGTSAYGVGTHEHYTRLDTDGKKADNNLHHMVFRHEGGSGGPMMHWGHSSIDSNTGQGKEHAHGYDTDSLKMHLMTRFGGVSSAGAKAAVSRHNKAIDASTYTYPGRRV